MMAPAPRLFLTAPATTTGTEVPCGAPVVADQLLLPDGDTTVPVVDGEEEAEEAEADTADGETDVVLLDTDNTTELVVVVCPEVAVEADGLDSGRAADDAAGGGSTLNVVVALHWDREDPLGQQPLSVQ